MARAVVGHRERAAPVASCAGHRQSMAVAILALDRFDYKSEDYLWQLLVGENAGASIRV